MKNEKYILQESFETLLVHLGEAERQEPNLFKRATACTHICCDFLRSAHEYVVLHGFPDPPSEIYFFKHIKPVVVGRCKYYQRICRLQLGPWKERSSWSTERFAKEMTMVEQFFEQNSSLWQYYRSGSTDWDEQYFMRRRHHWWWVPGQEAVDSLFSTPRDGDLADLLAMELYAEYIEQQLGLGQPAMKAGAQRVQSGILQCTAPAAHAAVLGLALHQVRFFNDGAVQKKTIMEGLQHSWNVNLENHARIIDQVKRQHEPDRFLRDLLKGFNDLLEGNGR